MSVIEEVTFSIFFYPPPSAVLLPTPTRPSALPPPGQQDSCIPTPSPSKPGQSPLWERIGGAAHLFAQVANGLTPPAVSAVPPLGSRGTYLLEPRERRRGGGGGALLSVSGDSAGAARHTAKKRPPRCFITRAVRPLACLVSSSISNSRDFSRQVRAGGRGSFRGGAFIPALSSTCWQVSLWGSGFALSPRAVLGSVAPQSSFWRLRVSDPSRDTCSLHFLCGSAGENFIGKGMVRELDINAVSLFVLPSLIPTPTAHQDSLQALPSQLAKTSFHSSCNWRPGSQIWILKH